MKRRKHIKSPTTEELSLMNQEQLKDLFIKVISSSMLDLIEPVIERRISQWFDVIKEQLEKTPTKT